MAETKKAAPAKKAVSAEKAVRIKKKTGPHGPRKFKNPRPVDTIHMGQIIMRVMKSRSLSKNKLAKILNVTPPTISLMVKGHSIQSDRLIAVSKVLNYNFFAEIADAINVLSDSGKGHELTGDTKSRDLQSKVADMEAELHFVKEENVFLKHIIELLAGQGKK
jgi:hypothetical protein